MAVITTTYINELDAFRRLEGLQSQGALFSTRFLLRPISEGIENHVTIFPNKNNLGLDQISNFSLPLSHASYMRGCLDDLTSKNVSSWLANRDTCECLNFQGYRILTHLDGVISDHREISFVIGEAGAFLPPHIHERSDAMFIITRGEAKFVTYTEERFVINRRRVSLWGKEPQVVADKTTDGEVTGFRFANGAVLTDVTSHPVRVGDVVLVPRRMPHGFIVPNGIDPLEFISIQSPPIHDEHTDKFDFVPLDDGPFKELIPKIFNY